MSWEIQGRVSGSADVDALAQAPTEAPSDAESLQVSEVCGVIKALLDAHVVGGPVYVRAGGHANPGGGPAEGAAHEMVTLTIDYDPTPAEPEVVEAPTEPPVVEGAVTADAAPGA